MIFRGFFLLHRGIQALGDTSRAIEKMRKIADNFAFLINIWFYDAMG
jgi:hypothetical protein